MKILMVSQFFAPVIGGEERFVEDLSVELMARGHEVAVATTTESPTRPADGLRIHHIPSLAGRLRILHADRMRRHAPPFPDPGAVASLRGILAAERPDIVHAHDWLVHSLVPAMGQRRPPLVLSLHDYGLVCANKRLIRDGERCIGPRLDRCLPCATRHYGGLKGPVITLALRPSTRAVLRRVAVCLPVSNAVAEGAELVSRGVPFEVISSFISDRLACGPWPPDAPVRGLPDGDYIVFAGDLAYDKGIHTVLEAHARLSDPPPLVLVGRGPAGEPVAPQRGVIWLGARPHGELMQIFRRSVAVVVPSIWSEPFGLVALEALAARRPVIASGVGGLTDIVEDGTSGILVPPRSVGALAAAISSLIASPARQDALGRAAGERAQAFRASVVVPRVEAVYRRLLDAGDRPGVDASNAAAAGA